jgi:hypothetical protein
VQARVLLADGAAGGGTPSALLPTYRDTRGEFRRAYGVRDRTAFLVRPDGYLGARLHPPNSEHLAAHLARVFRV